MTDPKQHLEMYGAGGSFLTRRPAFKKLTKWAFKVCDNDNTGAINKTELYAGLLLVHLNVAKYAGPAACYPPPKPVVDQLFEASDDDNSGGIDQEEFDEIMVILFSQITSRIAVYYGTLIFLVPYIAKLTVDFLAWIGVDDILLRIDRVFDAYAPAFLRWMIDKVPDWFWDTLSEQLVSLLLFFLVIPTLINQIDGYSRQAAARTVVVKSDETKGD